MIARPELLETEEPLLALDMIHKVISVGEFAVLSPKGMQLLAALLDDKLAELLYTFRQELDVYGINNNTPVANYLRGAVRDFDEIVMPRVKQLTFMLEVTERKCLPTIKALNILTYNVLVKDPVKTKADIDWLLANSDRWIGTIQPRRKSDWDDFVEELDMTVHNVYCAEKKLEELGVSFEMPSYPKCVAAAKENRVLFYEQHEKERGQQIQSILGKRKSLQIISHGLEYRIKCEESRIPLSSGIVIIR